LAVAWNSVLTTGFFEASGAKRRDRLGWPEEAQPLQLNRMYAIVVGSMHALCLLAFFPYFFSWSGLALGIAGHFVFGMMGIAIGYHRLLTHRGFKCPKWFEYTLAILGICNLQDSPARWVAIHRMHHQHSDKQADPHTPRAGFWWSHVGWVVYQNRNHDSPLQFERYVRDLLRDRFYLKLEAHWRWISIYASHAFLYLLIGFAAGWLWSGTLAGGLQLGLSWLVWGVFVRTVFVWHGTWAVNSVTHMFGYRNYDTKEGSRNQWLIALLTHGEGWHNNHHASQRSAAHGHKWWEIDMAWWTIRALEIVGLAKNVARPAGAPKSVES
jgi:stearoyl-CoA desaturase (delta-9 desaturase)